MRFSRSIRLHGVVIFVTGTYELADAPTRDHPGSKADVYPTTATIGDVDVMPLIDAGDWWEPLEKAIRDSLGEPVFA